MKVLVTFIRGLFPHKIPRRTKPIQPVQRLKQRGVHARLRAHRPDRFSYIPKITLKSSGFPAAAGPQLPPPPHAHAHTHAHTSINDKFLHKKSTAAIKASTFSPGLLSDPCVRVRADFTPRERTSTHDPTSRDVHAGLVDKDAETFGE